VQPDTSKCAFSLSPKAVIRDESDRILLLQRSAASRSNKDLWEFPGGKIDPGETFDVALVREIAEETGLDVVLERSVGSGSSELRERTVVYVFMEARLKSGDVTLSSEHSDYCWLPMSDLAIVAPRTDAAADVENLLSKTGEAIVLCPQYRAFATNYCRSYGYGPRPGEQESPKSVSPDDLDNWMADFTSPVTLERLSLLATTIEAILADLVHPVSPLAIIGARVKSAGSFAKKIVTKNKYSDPINQITDLVGARVITQTVTEIHPVCDLIRRRFIIDEKNSLDARDRLKASEFGYRSVHYVISLNPVTDTNVPPELYGMKVELQVRTILQHAWSDVGHDRLYKAGFKIPDVWERESARIAATIESADEAFTRLVHGVEEYRSDFGAYFDKEGLEHEIEMQRSIVRCAPEDKNERQQLARMLLAADRYDEVVSLVDSMSGTSNSLLVCKGMALCAIYRNEPSHSGFHQGRECFREAARQCPADVEAYVQLAATEPDEMEKLRLFDEAFKVDPGAPTALIGYIRQRILVERSVEFVSLLRPEMEAAILKCERQASVRVNLPFSLYIAAAFRLLGGEDESAWIEPLCRAVKMDQPEFAMDAPLKATRALKIATRDGHDAECALRFITAAHHTRFPNSETLKWVKEFATKGAPPIRGPVVIVAGGCDKAHADAMAGYTELLNVGFAGWQGSILSGGTKEGISGLVAALGAASDGQIHTLGYLPALLPPDGSAERDTRYNEIRGTNGHGFSALEPIQNWIDILASGISPSDVHLLGINGGRIAGMEFRIAWALGAKVAVVRGSGREADRVERDLLADQYPGMLVLPPDSASVRAFVRPVPPGAHVLTPDQQERLARFIHVRFLEENRHKTEDPAMKPWEYLDETLQKSNLDQAAYIISMLHATGLDVREASYPVPVLSLTTDEIEKLAQLEHGRWNVERLSSRWRWGEKRDVATKTTPFLVGWERLDGVDPRAKQWDRENVARFPQLLAEVGLGVIRGVNRMV